MGKCKLFLFMLKIILLRHKVGLCLHGHIFSLIIKKELCKYKVLLLGGYKRELNDFFAEETQRLHKGDIPRSFILLLKLNFMKQNPKIEV